jgi:hypothetical protein
MRLAQLCYPNPILMENVVDIEFFLIERSFLIPLGVVVKLLNLAW